MSKSKSDDETKTTSSRHRNRKEWSWLSHVFKVKGPTWQDTKDEHVPGVEIKNVLDKMSRLEDFARRTVTDVRLGKGIDALREEWGGGVDGKTPKTWSRADRDPLIKWMVNDVKVEEADGVKALAVKSDEFKSAIGKRVKEWFEAHLAELVADELA